MPHRDMPWRVGGGDGGNGVWLTGGFLQSDEFWSLFFFFFNLTSLHRGVLSKMDFTLL